MQIEDSETTKLLLHQNPQRSTVHDALSNGVAGDHHNAFSNGVAGDHHNAFSNGVAGDHHNAFSSGVAGDHHNALSNGVAGDHHNAFSSGVAGDHHHFHPSQYGTINGIQRMDSLTDDPLCSSVGSLVPHLHVYRRRWWILLVYSLLAFMQGGLGNVWSVIAASAEAVFGWTDNEISLMQLWLYVSYLVAMFPFAWLIDQKGLRISMAISAALLVVGTALRCITTSPPYATGLAHMAHIAIGLAGPVAFTSGPFISSMWFPPEQRATATAIATISGFAGGAGCFLLGPLIVEAPTAKEIIPPSGYTNETFSNVGAMRSEILLCRYIECSICCVIFMMVMTYFPSRPPSAPSITAAMGKLNFVSGLKDIFSRENYNFWLVCLPFGMSVSIYGVWSGLLGVNLKELVPETDIGWLGFSAVAAGCVAAVIFGRVSDVFFGHMKLILVLLNVTCILSTFWFLLIAEKYIEYSRVQLFAAAILQGLSNNGAVPLYYELAIENTYPVPEVCVSTIMTIVYNILPLLFLLIFLIPNVGTQWMNWFMYIVIIVCFPVLIAFKEKYKRLMVDRGTAPAPASIQASFQQSLSRQHSVDA